MRSDRIAHVFNDPGPFADAYVDLSQDHELAAESVALSIRDACDELSSAGAPPAVVDFVRSALEAEADGPAPISRFVVATERGVLLDELTRTRRPQPTATWGPLPDLAEWLLDESRSIPFVLAVVDHEGGGVTAYPGGINGEADAAEVGGETDFEHKVRGGGWAHLKWQHYSESVWARNARRVAEAVRRHVDGGIDLVLLAGDAQIRSEVVDFLGRVDATVMQVDTGGRNADGSDDLLQEAVRRALDEAFETARIETIDELQERLGRDGAAAIGVSDIADAFVRGQVGRLLIDPRAAADFTVEPADHPGLALGTVDPPPRSVPADRALVAAAALTGADIEIAPSSMLSGSPAAALLRWDQHAEGTHA
ncbi:MAG: hypothetical protein JWR55_3132 [Aeromicrobium sp.]|jgi:hypothetical protein|nr:hypothetical protein [Aeromicrobium sp.]